MQQSKTCPECHGSNLFVTETSSGGGHAPNYLPRLGSFWMAARFDVVLCEDCGLTRFFARREALQKLRTARGWQRL